MVNRSRPHGEHHWDESEAQRRFKKSHSKREIEEDCPDCGSSEFSHWRTNRTRLSDYDYCPDCGFGRKFMATG